MCIFFKRKNKKYPSNNKTAVNSIDAVIHVPTLNEEKETSVKTNAFIVEKVVFDAKEEKIQKYHVSQNKSQGTSSYMKWRVRKDSSDKTIQFFNTQKEGINYAKHLAENAKSSVVIHKLDGTIRKQDYTK